MPAPGPVSAPAPVASSLVAAPKQLVGDWTLAEKLTAIVVFTADSRKLTDGARQQLKHMLSDPTFVAWLVGSLLVWFVAHFFVVGEVIDMLLAGAALVLGGVGIVMAVQSLVGAAHLIGQFVEVTRAATDENDLKKAADILAEIIVMIGLTVLIAALTHATTRATSSGLEAKGSVKRPPPERAPKAERLQERPKSEGGGKTKTEAQLDQMYEKAPAAKAEIDQMAAEIANEHGGTVAKAPVKSKARALEKANNDYGGDASKVSDLARNTIVVPKEKLPDVASALKDKGARVKEITPEVDKEFGYSGINAKVETKAGITGEVQANSPEMIFAKEKPEIAREILGKDQNDAIAQKYGVPGGKGHELYEKARILPQDSPERAALAKESREYYDNFR
jgi:Na+-transporting methylmalonyl-CoA/oxaloacetate decarboxylase gamma subunit